MKARILKTNKVIEVYRTNQEAIGGECRVLRLYKDYEGREYWSDELELVPDDMPLSEPKEEVTIEGMAEKCIDGVTRVYVGSCINSFILPPNANIEGGVAITIKPKKK